ncbi:hypothetical protein CSAL01_00761 [Colletotrichum salicis]|uniref:Uncharacterized protein n=1 Tax=Colletotrichum salicis TaxID=1209931 RepID=A0A135RV77_9PEZI|nr:hypothetical protein CSAL01_00761 [Colletotrichum salicis]
MILPSPTSISPSPGPPGKCSGRREEQAGTRQSLTTTVDAPTAVEAAVTCAAPSLSETRTVDWETTWHIRLVELSIRYCQLHQRGKQTIDKKTTQSREVPDATVQASTKQYSGIGIAYQGQSPSSWASSCGFCRLQSVCQSAIPGDALLSFLETLDSALDSGDWETGLGRRRPPTHTLTRLEKRHRGYLGAKRPAAVVLSDTKYLSHMFTAERYLYYVIVSQHQDYHQQEEHTKRESHEDIHLGAYSPFPIAWTR